MGRMARIRNEIVISRRPDVANNREPYLSESQPERGPIITKPTVRGNMKIPPQKGVDS
jgi:hypothetical protein